MVTVVSFAAAAQHRALLVAASTPASFNDGFYVAAATVIPVLYLALTIQGPMLPGLLTRLHKALETMRRPQPGVPVRPWKLLAALIVAYATMSIAAAILVLGVLGELGALRALAQRHDSAASQSVTLWSVVFLLLLTAAGPAWALNMAWARLQWVQIRTAWRMTRPAWHPHDAESDPADHDAADSGAASRAEPTTPPTRAGPEPGGRAGGQ